MFCKTFGCEWNSKFEVDPNITENFPFRLVCPASDNVTWNVTFYRTPNVIRNLKFKQKFTI